MYSYRKFKSPRKSLKLIQKKINRNYRMKDFDFLVILEV